MLRIRGTVGDVPVDLSVEMDDADWARLGAHWPVVANAPTPSRPSAPQPAGARPDDSQWQAALMLLEAAGRLSGPELLEQLEGLAGSMAAGKRLLVRLRHSSLVRVQSAADAPVYCWVGPRP